MMTSNIRLEDVVHELVKDYVTQNRAARIMRDGLAEAGVGLFPVLDHITVRTLAIDKRAEEFVRLGYTYSETLHYQDWWAKVYRAPGYPALFIDQAYEGERGEPSIIPHWVDKFGDQTLHHIAIRVEDIEASIQRLKSKGMQFAGEIVGEPGGDLRQIFSVPEQVNNEPFSVLELTERHHGYQGFSPPQADSLMQSTVR
jgi:catechol 2,3-dioxygenase-like lactoylglutathione lyase family enzyme